MCLHPSLIYSLWLQTITILQIKCGKIFIWNTNICTWDSWDLYFCLPLFWVRCQQLKNFLKTSWCFSNLIRVFMFFFPFIQAQSECISQCTPVPSSDKEGGLHQKGLSAKSNIQIIKNEISIQRRMLGSDGGRWSTVATPKGCSRKKKAIFNAKETMSIFDMEFMVQL